MKKYYTGRKTEQISFPLGGIGTGSVGLSGNGRLVDWEIFNRPNKGSFNGYTHFAVKAIRNGQVLDARVLNGPLTTDLMGQRGSRYGWGAAQQTMAGFPHFDQCRFEGEFPLATLTFSDKTFPARVRMRAFNPLIPHNAKASSIPAAFFEIEMINIGTEDLDFAVAFSLRNPYAVTQNRYFGEGSVRGITLMHAEAQPLSAEAGDISISTDAADISYQEYWYRGGWQDSIETYWRNFAEETRFENRTYEEVGQGKRDYVTLCAHLSVKAEKRAKVRFVLSWNNPIIPDQWGRQGEEPIDGIRNYYSYVFRDSRACAVYALRAWNRLYRETKTWHDALFSSTLPDEVIEAVSATSSVLKTSTCLRVGEKGDVWGWEGLNEQTGSCYGTCTHVWNYAYVMPYLFPELERNIRENDYRYNQRAYGKMVFRTKLPFGRTVDEQKEQCACLDGQMGGVIKVWREWKLSGDTGWMLSLWEKVKKSMEYVWSEGNPHRWDRDMDGILEGRQHHTLDMELFGPSSWLQGFYLGALKAANEMAAVAKDEEFAQKCANLFEKGKEWMDKNLFNGDYFIQKVDLGDHDVLAPYEDGEKYWNEEVGELKYQIGDGCAIDQMLAQWHADIIGLGEIFDPEQVQVALQNLFKNNFVEHIGNTYNTWRLYAVGGESGTLICTYPPRSAGTRKPAIPIPYNREAMHGFEYALAGLLISRGFTDEGLRLVRSVRERYDGQKRNPWNEMEAGSNYARSMAAFALIPIFSGQICDLTRGLLGFDPKLGDRFFRSVWSAGNAWGTVTVDKERAALRVYHGTLTLQRLRLPNSSEASVVMADGRALPVTFRDGELIFDPPVTVRKNIQIS